MKLLQTSLYFIVFYLTLYSVVPSVLAQSNPAKKTWQISQQFKPPIDNQPNPITIGAGTRFKPPVDDEPNPPTVGAATRGSSCLKQQEMIPLLPKNQSGQTLNEHPTFFWYIPPTEVKKAEFVIVNEEEAKEVYKTTLTMPDQPGIVSFTLPKKVAPLETNTTYRWYITLICDEEDFSKNPYVEGAVKRIPAELPLSESLAKSNLLQMATLYAQSGIWHDALTSLVQLRCNQPNDPIIKLHWKHFLDSVGLNDIASQPLVDFCTIQN